MHDPYRDGIDPRNWNLDGLRKRREAEEKGRQPQERSRRSRSAAEMDLPYEIRYALGRHGSHPSEWEPIRAENDLYNLRTGEHILIFRQTRKGWESLKELNGAHSGQKVLAFRHRNHRAPRRVNAAGGAWETQFAYDETVTNFFFHRGLTGYINKDGFPAAERLYQRRRISLAEWERIYADSEPIVPASQWIGLILSDADGEPASGYAYQLRDSSGAIRQGNLNDRGEAELHGLSDGPVEVTFGEPVGDQAINAQRETIKQELERILQAEREESARIESELQEKSLLGKFFAYDNARTKGMHNAVWGMLTGLKELSDLGTQHLNHALGAAWDTWRYRDEGHYVVQFAQRFAEAQFQEVIDILGFDPRSLTREQWAETQVLVNFLWHDDETQELLLDFAKDYIKAQHSLEVIETGFGITTEIAIDVLIAALTLGAGATVAVATKIRHVDKLGGLGKALRQLAQKLKQRKGSKQATSRTGEWLEQRLEKPENRSIEKGAVGEHVASHGPSKGEYDALANRLAPNKGNPTTDFVGDAGRLGGELYSPKKLSQLEGYLSRRGIELRLGDEHVPLGKAGGFNADKGFLILRDNPTNYEVWHELSHFRQYQKLGRDTYLDLPRTRDFNAPEQFVFDMLENSPKRWNSLNFDEQQHAIRYIENIGGFR